MKKLLVLVLILCMVLPSFPVLGATDVNIFVSHKDFQNHMGTWVFPDEGGSFEGHIKATDAFKPALSRSAAVDVEIPSDGEYYVFVRTRDYSSMQGERYCMIAVGGKKFDKVLGKHAVNDWAWEDVGSVSLKKGKATVELIDTAAYNARIEGIILTTNKNITLPDDKDSFITFKTKNAAKISAEPFVNGLFENGVAPATPVETTPTTETKVDTKKGTHIFVEPKDFKNHMGTWVFPPNESGSFGDVIKATDAFKPALSKSAAVDVKIPADGEYFVFVRARDYASMQGSRYCMIAVGGKKFDKVLGKHANDGWAWEEAGSVTLKKGKATVELIDTAAYNARIEGIVLSTNKNVGLPNDKDSFNAFKTKYAATTSGKPFTNGLLENGVTSSNVVVEEEVPVAEVELKADKTYITLDYESFKEHMGYWKLESAGLLGKCLFSMNKSYTNTDNQAQTKFGIPETGFYKILIHTMDNNGNPGARTFRIQPGEDRQTIDVGCHGVSGWKWEDLGTFPFNQGEHTFYAMDINAYYSRFDMVIITDDLDFKIEESKDNMKKMLEHRYVPGTVITEELSSEPDADRPDDEIAVKFNGKYLDFDVKPTIINGRTMVPFRKIFEALNCTVSWDDEDFIASGSRNGYVVSLPIGNTTAYVNSSPIDLDQPAELIDGRTMVPLRFVSESMGALVSWNGATNTVSILATIPETIYLLRPESFGDLGTWSLENNSSAFSNSSLRGITSMEYDPGLTQEMMDNPKPAVAKFKVSEAGKYTVWVHANDNEKSPGTRYFNVGINGVMSDTPTGNHGETGFRWMKIGEFDFKEGYNTIELYDTSRFYARCDAVVVSKNPEFVPYDGYAQLTRDAYPSNPFEGETTAFPKWAKSSDAPYEQIEIVNDNTKVIFYKVNTQNGTVIQNEIQTMHFGNWVTTKKRDEGFGYLMISADASVGTGGASDVASFKNTYTVNDEQRAYVGRNVYKSGRYNWFIPKDYSIEGNKVTLYFDDSQDSAFTATWELIENEDAPKVSLDATFKNPGYHSIGVFEGKDFSDAKIDFAMIPFRVMSKQMTPDMGLTTEHYAFTPMATVTLTKDNEYIKDYYVTKGVVAEPSWLDLGWVYANTSKLGLTVNGPSGGYQGALFSPLFGKTAPKFEAGQSYNMQYRVISRIDDWYNNYKYVAEDLFDVTDYRENYYASLNEAIYNTRKLMLEKDLSGWDPYDKAFYNMESIYSTTNASPLAVLQSYLMTENEQILEERAVPIIASMLTRSGFHFNRHEGEENWQKAWGTTAIGQNPMSYNLNVMGGLYDMTRGTLPYILNYSTEKALKEDANGTTSDIAPFVRDLALYKYTGDKKYLDKAIELADKYIEDVVYAPQTKQIHWDGYTYKDYYPNLSSLMDIYEVTKEQRFLDAAEYVGRWITAFVWVPGVDGDKKDTVITVNKPADIQAHWSGTKEDNPTPWWHGEQQWRQGTPDGDPGNITEAIKNVEAAIEDVPAWLPSRVGLGMEQALTFTTPSNIVMQVWAGDMVKLSKLTGDKYFESVARNAMIGRFGGYSGYYIQTMWTYYMHTDYAFKGPDYSSIYWHHIPPFMAMLEDFLINQIWAWSDGNIEFPYVRQQGYSYFESKQYGHEPGTFFGYDDMWLWLDEDVITPDSVQIDYLAARKDGVFGAAFINESNSDIETTFTLGSKVPGGSTYSGPAKVFNADKSTYDIYVENGKFKLTMPAKGFKAVIIKFPNLKAPAYSKMDNEPGLNLDVKESVAEHTGGKAFAIQMTPENYFAYVYLTDKASKVKSVTIYYTIEGKEEQSQTIDVFPYEFIIKVDDSSKSFTYRLEKTAHDGTVTEVTGGTIRPIVEK